MKYNIKPRIVHCKACDIYLDSDQPAPKCPTCGFNLVTVVQSVFNRCERCERNKVSDTENELDK